jgi:hypothetical protein
MSPGRIGFCLGVDHRRAGIRRNGRCMAHDRNRFHHDQGQAARRRQHPAPCQRMAEHADPQRASQVPDCHDGSFIGDRCSACLPRTCTTNVSPVRNVDCDYNHLHFRGGATSRQPRQEVCALHNDVVIFRHDSISRATPPTPRSRCVSMRTSGSTISPAPGTPPS